MGDARGCRGGFRRGLRRCRLAPRCRSLCCRLMASALFGMRAAPSRRNGGPRPSSALALNRGGRPRLTQMAASAGRKSLRARCGVPLRPPCALAAPVRRGSGGGRAVRQAPAIPFFSSGGGWLLPAHSAAVAPPPGLAAGSQGRGGLLQRPDGPPRRCGGAPLRSSPAPRFWRRGRGYFIFAAAGLGIAPPAGGAKGLPDCTRCAIRCGVHGFAMNPYYSLPVSTAPYYREARVTFARRQTACRMRHCCARRIVECSVRRKLGCTSTRWAERQRIIEAEANRLAMLTRQRRAQAFPFRRHKGHSRLRLPI